MVESERGQNVAKVERINIRQEGNIAMASWRRSGRRGDGEGRKDGNKEQDVSWRYGRGVKVEGTSSIGAVGLLGEGIGGGEWAKRAWAALHASVMEGHTLKAKTART